MLTVERLRECLDYDPSTGIFKWKIKVCNKKVGQIAPIKLPPFKPTGIKPKQRVLV